MGRHHPLLAASRPCASPTQRRRRPRPALQTGCSHWHRLRGEWGGGSQWGRQRARARARASLPPTLGAPGPPLPADPLDSLEVAEPLGRTSTWFMRTLGRVRPGNWGALALKSPLLLSACSPRSPRCAHGPDGLGSCVGDEHENVLTDLASGGAHAAVCTRVCV